MKELVVEAAGTKELYSTLFPRLSTSAESFSLELYSLQGKNFIELLADQPRSEGSFEDVMLWVHSVYLWKLCEKLREISPNWIQVKFDGSVQYVSIKRLDNEEQRRVRVILEKMETNVLMMKGLLDWSVSTCRSQMELLEFQRTILMGDLFASERERVADQLEKLLFLTPQWIRKVKLGDNFIFRINRDITKKIGRMYPDVLYRLSRRQSSILVLGGGVDTQTDLEKLFSIRRYLVKDEQPCDGCKDALYHTESKDGVVELKEPVEVKEFACHHRFHSICIPHLEECPYCATVNP